MINKLKNNMPENFARTLKKVYMASRRIYYAGTKYKCPICEHSFRKLLPGGFNLEIIKQKEIIGAGYRENNICPYCQSTDRDRLIYLYLKNRTEIFSNKLKVLHVSPEPALFRLIDNLKNIVYVVGTKYSEGIYYPKRITSIDLLNLPYNNHEFDLVICNHVLEHIIDDKRAMSEIFRVLVPGGLAILQVPYSNLLDKTYEDNTVVSESDREKHFGQFDHVRIYGKDYKNRLENVGFKLEVYDPIIEDNYNKERNIFAINVLEKLFVGHKNKT